MSIIEMKEAEFKAKLQEGGPLLVEYWAPWCTYCRRIGAAYHMVAEENRGRLTAAKVDIDQEPQLASLEGIEVVPTLILYQGGKRLGALTAPGSKAEIDEFIRKTLAPDGQGA